MGIVSPLAAVAAGATLSRSAVAGQLWATAPRPRARLIDTGGQDERGGRGGEGTGRGRDGEVMGSDGPPADVIGEATVTEVAEVTKVTTRECLTGHDVTRITRRPMIAVQQRDERSRVNAAATPRNHSTSELLICQNRSVTPLMGTTASRWRDPMLQLCLGDA